MTGIRPDSGMADVFVEWRGGGPGDNCGVAALRMLGCSELHRIKWRESLIDEQGERLLCHFLAPDAESVRVALRFARLEADAIWTGSIRHGRSTWPADVVFEHSFAEPLPADADAALDMVMTRWLDPNGLELDRAILSCSRRRVVCLCKAPAGGTPPISAALPGTAIWPCRRVAA